MACRPSPGSAHPAPDRPRQPREGDFEGLIAELTSEFKRLQWQLSDLASENEDLRKHLRHLPIEDGDMQLRSATAETSHLDQDCDEFVLSASVRPSEQVSDRVPQAACARSSMTGWSSESRAARGRHSSASIFAHRVEGTLKRERATELGSPKGVFGHGRDVGHGHEGQQSTPIHHAHSGQDLHDDIHHRQISRSASSCKLRESIVKHMDQAIAQSSIFEKLDTDGKGELLLGDLSRILSLADETMECVMLVNIVRLANGLDPVEVEHMENADDGDLMESHHELGLDVHAFTRLMDPALEIDEDYEDAVWTLRAACESQSHNTLSRGGRKTRVSFAMPLRSVDTESLYRRRAPCLIETIVPFVILSDLLMMGLAADHAEHSNIWDLCEYIFVVIYILEVLIKLHLHGCHAYFTGPDRHWNWFDCSCLAVSLGYMAIKLAVSFIHGQDTSGILFILIRMLRLSRLARLVRTLRFRIFAELKMIVLGVVSGLRMLIWALVLLFMIIYVVAVAATNLFGGAEPEFKNMEASMFTLYRCWTEGCAAKDGTPLSERLRESYGFSWALFHVFMSMFIEVGLFNLIMAVFVDNVRSSQLLRKHIEMVEHSNSIERRFKEIFASFIKNGTGSRTSLSSTMDKLNRVNHHMMGFAATDHKVDWAIVEKEWEVLREMDVVITKEVFNDWLEEPRLQELLDDAEIIHANRFELFDILDCDMGGQLSMDELTTGLMKLRGDITKSDIVAINLKVRHLTAIMEGYAETRIERLPSRVPSSEHHFSRKSSRHHTR